jgi:hypothetical protein
MKALNIMRSLGSADVAAYSYANLFRSSLKAVRREGRSGWTTLLVLSWPPFDQAAALMKPYAGAIEPSEVSAEVGNVKNNRPELIERAAFYAPSRCAASTSQLSSPACKPLHQVTLIPLSYHNYCGCLGSIV